MALTYRQMEVGDLPAVFDVRLSTVENRVTMQELEQTYGVTPETLAAAMEADVKGWLCEAAGNVIGFAMGDRSNGEVQVVAVRPEHEGRGVGRALLARVRNWLFSEGHEEIWLLANPDPQVRAHGFYRKLGWRATGQRRGEDEVMKLRRAGGSSDPVSNGPISDR